MTQLLRNLARKLIPRGVRNALRALSGRKSLYVSHPDRVDGWIGLAADSSARVTVLDPERGGRVSFGRGVYLGRGVEVTAAGGGSIHIDDDTSLQDGTVVAGHVRIGAHCLIGKYNFLASRGHTFRRQPTWLIRDQDEEAMRNLPSAAMLESSLLRIEEDCWLGQSVVVTPGIYIGRGAVVGANTVVASPISPYEIHAGAPNRKIGARLEFAPPPAISAMKDDDLPYFYRGFRLSRETLAESRARESVRARSACCLVLAGMPGGRLTVMGASQEQGQLRLKINGEECGAFPIASGPFEISAAIPAVAGFDDVPALLRAHTFVELFAAGPVTAFGVSSAQVSLF